LESDPRFAALLDKQELRELTQRYCRGVDRGDKALILSCYHPDGTDDHGIGPEKPEDFADRVIAAMREDHSWHHALSGQLFEIDGDTALGETYYIFHSVTHQLNQGMSCFGRYIDQFERRVGTWKILRRSVIVDWMGQLPGDLMSRGSFLQSQPNMNDPVYDIRAVLNRQTESC